jgi:hypothetical protein
LGIIAKSFLLIKALTDENAADYEDSKSCLRLTTNDHQVSITSKAVLTCRLYKPQHGHLLLVEVAPSFSFVQAAAVGSLGTFFSPLVHVGQAVVTE